MKKIALLFTILCAGQLYGMEAERIGDLPEDVHREIVKKAIESSDNLKDAIKALNVASALRGARYDDLKDFTQLVHILADKFDMTTQAVAVKFNTSASKRYLNLMFEVTKGTDSAIKDVDKLTQLIKQGLDVNFTYLYSYTSPLIMAIEQRADAKIVKLLLDSGANPHYKDNEGQTALDHAKKMGAPEEIIQLLAEAMKQKQQ